MTIWNNLTHEGRDKRRDLQISYEQEMLEHGRNKYWDEYNRAPDEGIPEQELMDSSIKELRDTYQEWIDSVCSSLITPRWVAPLLELGAQKMADVTIRAVIRTWFSSTYWGYDWQNDKIIPPLAQTIAIQIAQDTSDIISYQRARESNRDNWLKQSKFIKNWTTKRCKAFAKKMGEVHKLTVKQKHDYGHHMLRIAATSNIIILTQHRTKRGRAFKSYLSVEFHPEVLKELHKRHEFLQASTLVYRPMLSRPEPHTLKHSGGYIHTELRKPLVQKYRSNFFGDYAKEQKFSRPSQDVVDGINILSGTEWAINTEVLEVMENLFTNNTGLANLPMYSFEEFMYNAPYPKTGSKEDQAKWCQAREEKWGQWYKNEQGRGRMLIRLKLAKELIPLDYFFHSWTMDFRGRAYTICELLSPQSSDLDRGLIRFANGVELTPRGRWWQKIHLANLFDQDKLAFEDRVKWVDDNWEMINEISKDPYENREWIDESVKKNKSFQRLASIMDITRDDNLTFVPVQIDGKCNGNQHWSAIVGDKPIAKLTGVLPSEEPKDLYQFVADKTTDYCLKAQDPSGWLEQFMLHWNNTIDRSVTKRSTMCEPYGITFYGIQRYIKEEGHLSWVSKDKLGGAIVELARAIKASLDTSLGGPNTGKLYLKELVNIANDLNRHVEWTTPSGFRVVHYYNKQQKRRSLATLFNAKELTFYIRTNDVNSRAALQAISPNFIHSIDAAHMFLTIVKVAFYGITDFSMLHDSYGCHANYVDLMRNCLREEFLKIHSENLLEKFRGEVEKQLGVKLPDPPKRGELELETVLESEYFFA